MAKKEIEYFIEQGVNGEWELVNYVTGYVSSRPTITLTENDPFEAKLTILEAYSGRSASGMEVKVEGHSKIEVIHGRMVTSELLKVIKNNTIEHGVVPSMKVKFGKRGRNYFIVTA